MELITGVILWFYSAWMLTYFWNSIAVAFNLPQFGYWVAFSAIYILYILKPSVRITNAKDGKNDKNEN